MEQPSPPPEPVDAGNRSRFGELHSRTYEMELLVSGAVVFGLLQLPGPLVAAFDRYRSVLAGGLRTVESLAQGYVMMMLYVLIGTFLLHLVLRAYWIGLLGLESVFPAGIRWDRLKGAGPLTLRTYRRRLGSLAGAVDRTDDRCSLIFSFGFLLVAAFAYSLVVLALAGLVALALSWVPVLKEHVAAVFWVALGVVVGLQLVAGFLDRRLGTRLNPAGVPMRLLARLVDIGFLTSPMRWTGSTQLALASNISATRVAALIIGVSLLLGAGNAVFILARGGLLHLDSLSYFPLSLREEGVDPVHYRDRWKDAVTAAGSPSVQSAFVEEPYLELVVAYVPERHNALLRAACPGVASLRGEGLLVGRSWESAPEAARTAADCLGGLLGVRLDGEELTALRWDFTAEPGSRLPAVVSFVSVRGLAEGRHELEVRVPGRRARVGAPDLERHVIPFWR